MSVEIEVNDSFVKELEESLDLGPMADDLGRRFLNEELIERSDGFSFHIFADEHPPPHFCVKYNGKSASFSIEDCTRLRKNKGLEKYERNIRKWYEKNRSELISRWNATRPTDCPVGEINVT